MLSELNPEKVCFLIVKIREFDVQVEEKQDGGSNASDDGFVAVFEDSANTSVRAEVEQFIASMDVDERRELIALSLVGRGDYAKVEWTDAMQAAGSQLGSTTAKLFLENPTVSDDLEEGLSIFDLSCADFDAGRM